MAISRFPESTKWVPFDKSWHKSGFEIDTSCHNTSCSTITSSISKFSRIFPIHPNFRKIKKKFNNLTKIWILNSLIRLKICNGTWVKLHIQFAVNRILSRSENLNFKSPNVSQSNERSHLVDPRKPDRCLAGRMAMHACQIDPTDTAPPCPGSPQRACVESKGGPRKPDVDIFWS